MNNNITEYLKEYKNCISEQTTLNLKLEALNKRISELESLINKIGDHGDEIQTNKSSNIGYNANWTNVKKAKWCLEEERVCLTVREIVDKIKYTEGNTEDQELDRKLIGSLSSVLSTKSKDEFIFKRFKPEDSSQILYGLKEWWNGQNELPEENFIPK